MSPRTSKTQGRRKSRHKKLLTSAKKKAEKKNIPLPDEDVAPPPLIDSWQLRQQAADLLHLQFLSDQE